MSDNEKPQAKPSGNGPDTDAEPKRLGDEGGEAPAVEALESARAEAEKFKNDFLYLRAEFENYKKQVAKERSDLRKYGAERLIVDLLGVLDIFELALSTEVTPENVANFRKGVEMTANELKNVLQRHGVTEVSENQKFDPAVHEALSSEETNEVPPGTILKVFKKPYKLHDRLIRPGQVIVAKEKSQ